MSTTPTDADFDDYVPQTELFEITEEEWRAAAILNLRRIGLTYDELAEQAKDDRFDSVEAMLVWRMVLCGRRP